ncbi:MAG: hypothetical protein ACOYL7_08265, partial [Caldilinea sp.]
SSSARTASQFCTTSPPADSPIFTDDRSQVEEVVHRLIFNFLVGTPPPHKPTEPSPSQPEP